MHGFWEPVVFYTLAVLILGSAVMVVTLRNIVHCALFLMLTFICVAGIYILLHAEFIALVQVLIYVGAVTILILFAIMLTQQIYGAKIKQSSRLSPLGVIAGMGFLALVCLLSSSAAEEIFRLRTDAAISGSTASIARGLLGNGVYVLPFEVASLLLLVAMVGAIIIARERDE